jgi:hypothetical protein
MLGTPPVRQPDEHQYKRLAIGKPRWLAVFLALAVVVGGVALGAPGVLLELAVLVLGVALVVALVRSPDRGWRHAVLLGVMVAVVLATGTLKAAWLAADLPSAHDQGSGLPYLLMASLAPLAMTITAGRVSQWPAWAMSDKVVRIEVVGLAVGFLPWIVLMMTGIAD